MNESERIKTNKLIYPELSYTIMGVLFKVHNKLGSTYQEKYYQRAIATELKTQGIKFEKEKQIELRYELTKIGNYFIDFVIDGKIIIETKAVPFIRDEWLNQLVAYLISTKLPLGIIANFRTPKLTYKRIVNPNIDKIRSDSI